MSCQTPHGTTGDEDDSLFIIKVVNLYSFFFSACEISTPEKDLRQKQRNMKTFEIYFRSKFSAQRIKNGELECSNYGINKTQAGTTTTITTKTATKIPGSIVYKTKQQQKIL